MKATLCGALKLNGAKEEEDLLLRRVEALKATPHKTKGLEKS